MGGQRKIEMPHVMFRKESRCSSPFLINELKLLCIFERKKYKKTPTSKTPQLIKATGNLCVTVSIFKKISIYNVHI